jgi:ABC-type uncharacterized transport system substrate-binding protein
MSLLMRGSPKELAVQLRGLLLGMLLIAAASAVLLMSDPKRYTDDDAKRLKIAVVNYAVVPVLEDGQRGVLDGLAESGFVEGRNVEVNYQNAAGDRATATVIAKTVVSGDADLVISLSTPMLQAVAAANVTEHKPHLFTLSTDPWGAGVGIQRDDPAGHPPYMTGYGTLQPVRSAFEMARDANPDLQSVGVIWNPSEQNSEASVLEARKVCRELGFDLDEVTVDTSAAVSEAAKALVARNVEAIWAGGDSTVASAFQTVVAAAREGGIPVFTNMPSDVKLGALFAVGADYYEVGRAGGLRAAEVLRGADPAKIPVENYVPRETAVNITALEGLSGWKIPPAWIANSGIVVTSEGVKEKQRVRSAEPIAGETYRIELMYFAPNAITRETIVGLKERLRQRGFVEGKNLVVQENHAQGDISLIPTVLQKCDTSDADLIVTFTTPCLTAASSVVENKPVVFTEVYDPIAAGAGTSADDHLPNLTGVGSFPPLAAMIDTMQQLVPDLQAVGVVYNNSEANSRKAVAVAHELFAKRGLRLEEATVANSSEVLQAAQSLMQRDVQVLWELGDNTVNQALEGLVKAGDQGRIPVVNSDATASRRGAVMGVGIRFYDSGVAAGDLVARVLTGESPATIPFEEVAVVSRCVNLQKAKQLDIGLSPALLKKCDVFAGLEQATGRTARIAYVELMESPTLDEAHAGLLAGLMESGLAQGADFEMRRYSAQGEIAQLPQIMANVIDQDVDLIVTSTTPAMIAAAHATPDIPIVFTVASYPPRVGLFREGERQKNLVGVYDDPPTDRLLDLAKSREGSLKKVGVVWNPAEPNSEYSVSKLRKECQERGIELIERHAANVNELTDATLAVCHAGAEILVLSADNVATQGFPAIAKAAKTVSVPIYVTEPDLVQRGAAAGIGDDYTEWGKQSGRLAAKVLCGAPVEELELESTAAQKTLVKENLPGGA